MLNPNFESETTDAVAFIRRYHTTIGDRRVKTDMQPGDVLNQIPATPPEEGTAFAQMLEDTEQIILPGLTHWQHPGFMGLFPSNISQPSFLGEVVAAGLGVNCMMWDTAPAAAELEQRMMEWLRQLSGLPDTFQGVLQDTASTATLTAIILAREKITGHSANEEGLYGLPPLVMYTSAQAHMSVEKGAKAAGIGSKNVRKIQVLSDQSMDTEALRKAIEKDKEAGLTPFMVTATAGTTGSLAFDNLEKIGALCQEFNLWMHVDAAYAGNAFLLPEYDHLKKGIARADSYVFNPHKWLFTHFDCSAFYIKDTEHLLRTFSTSPDYLRASREGIRNYKDWGLPLGRLFRALKLWYVMRGYGRKGLQQLLRHHITLTEELFALLSAHPHWEFAAPMAMNVITLRWRHMGLTEEQLNDLNRELLADINRDGRFYLTPTILDGRFVIRIVPAQTNLSAQHIKELYHLMESKATAMDGRFS